jgi:lambda repressor-like predicted transcriptional regulator
MSLTIGSVTSHHGPPPAGGPGGANPMKQVMAGAASLLGMSDDELRTALRGGGTTLADLAAGQGVSKDDLLAAATKGVREVGPPPGAEGVDAATIAQGIIDGTGRPGTGRGPDAHGGPPPADRGADMAARLGSLTSALGMDETAFFDALKAGTSLTQLADEHGVSQSALKQILLGPVSVDTRA